MSDPSPADAPPPSRGGAPVGGGTPTQGSTPAEGGTPTPGSGPAGSVAPSQGPTPGQGFAPSQGPTPEQDFAPSQGPTPAQGFTPAEHLAPNSTNRPSYRARLLIAVGLTLVLILAVAVSSWIWVFRPRQLVEVHDDTGRISVLVPRAWTKHVDGRAVQPWNAHLFVGQYEQVHLLKVAVFDGIGELDLPENRCGAVAPEDLANNDRASDLRLWAFRGCPKDKVTLVMEKSFDDRLTLIVDVTANSERKARQILDSVDVKSR